jgi:transposase
MPEPKTEEEPTRRAGRPTKLTPEVADRICQAVAGGNYREVAAAWAGIGERTLREWMRRGEDPRSRYHDFRRRVLEAEQAAEIRAVGLIMASAAKDPKHAQWWLQRKHPDRWGRTERLSVRGEVKHEFGDDEQTLLANIAKAVLARRGIRIPE